MNGYDSYAPEPEEPEPDWFECRTCSYGTNSEDKIELHMDEHLMANRRDPRADIPAQYREFFYDSTRE